MAKQERAAPVCKRVYIDSDGTEHHNMPADPSGITSQQFRFTNGETRVIDVTEFSDAVRFGAEWHGFNQTCGDAFSAAKGDVAEAMADFDARMKTLLAGVWTARTGGGAKTDSILCEAMLAYFTDIDKTETKDGDTIDAAWIRAFLLAEDADEDDMKKARSDRAASWKANDGVKKHYAKIRAAREAKKAATTDAADATDL